MARVEQTPQGCWTVVGPPLAGHVAKVSDEARAALVSEVGDALTSCLAGGALTFPIESHLGGPESERGRHSLSPARSKTARYGGLWARRRGASIPPQAHEVASKAIEPAEGRPNRDA